MYGVLGHRSIMRRTDIYDSKFFTFCLGGERRGCSLVELAWRLDLYDQFLVMIEGFDVFIDHFHNTLHCFP